MSSFCPISGYFPCNCDSPLAATPLGAALLLDTKAVLRKIFTDHVVYINWLFLQPNDSVIDRLSANVRDIGNLLQPIIGDPKSYSIANLFNEHLSIIIHLVNGDNLEDSASLLHNNGNLLAAALNDIKPNKLSSEYFHQLLLQHNNFILQLANGRANGAVTGEYITIFDELFKHTLILADVIYETLIF